MRKRCWKASNDCRLETNGADEGIAGGASETVPPSEVRRLFPSLSARPQEQSSVRIRTNHRNSVSCTQHPPARDTNGISMGTQETSDIHSSDISCQKHMGPDGAHVTTTTSLVLSAYFPEAFQLYPEQFQIANSGSVSPGATGEIGSSSESRNTQTLQKTDFLEHPATARLPHDLHPPHQPLGRRLEDVEVGASGKLRRVEHLLMPSAP